MRAMANIFWCIIFGTYSLLCRQACIPIGIRRRIGKKLSCCVSTVKWQTVNAGCNLFYRNILIYIKKKFHQSVKYIIMTFGLKVKNLCWVVSLDERKFKKSCNCLQLVYLKVYLTMCRNFMPYLKLMWEILLKFAASAGHFWLSFLV